MHNWANTGTVHRLGLGRQLSLAREKAGLSVDELAERTRLSHRVIAAVESGNHVALGARIYAMGANRNYARAVGIDPNQAVADLVYEMRLSWDNSGQNDVPTNLKPRRSFWGKRGHISVMGL